MACCPHRLGLPSKPAADQQEFIPSVIRAGSSEIKAPSTARLRLGSLPGLSRRRLLAESSRGGGRGSSHTAFLQRHQAPHRRCQYSTHSSVAPGMGQWEEEQEVPRSWPFLALPPLQAKSEGMPEQFPYPQPARLRACRKERQALQFFSLTFPGLSTEDGSVLLPRGGIQNRNKMVSKTQHLQACRMKVASTKVD